jgi:hypothetical protein
MPPGPFTKRTTSAAFHVAPAIVDACVAMTSTRRSDGRTLSSRLRLKKPTHMLSGDQNGVLASSEPAISTAASVVSSSLRIHNRLTLSRPTAT